MRSLARTCGGTLCGTRGRTLGATLLGALAFVPCAHGQAAPSRPATATSTESLARALLTRLVAINTTQTEGATTPAADTLAARFRAAGFPAADVVVVGPNAKRRNLVVRWRGRDRTRKPVVFAAHLDVVEAPKLEWSTSPFRLTEKDGFLYGRGVLDDKGPAAAISAAVIHAKQSGRMPERDLIFAFTAGEESGVDNGAEWLLKNHRALLDAEYALILDAGGGDLVDGKVVAYAMQSAEKIYLDLELVASGPGGHSSAPPDTSPLDRLARAIVRVDQYRFPVKLNPVVRAYFAARAPLTADAKVRSAMQSIAAEPDDLAAQSLLLSNPDTRHHLRTTCIATMLRGGTAPNALPQEVGATVNCRLLPGETGEGTIALLRRAIGDSTVQVRTLIPALASEASVPSSAFLDGLRRVVDAVAPGVPIVPYMESGATDGVYFRNAGIPSFGVNGFFLDTESLDRMHGRDERISLTGFRDLVRYTDALLAETGRFAPLTGAGK